MIRVLVIGPDAAALSGRLRPAAPGVDFESARLPAAAVRAFEKSPPDVVVLCGSNLAQDRVVAVLAALRARPLGGLVPCVWVGEGELEDTEACIDPSVDPRDIVERLAELVGADLEGAAEDSPERAQRHAAPLTEQVIEQKLRQVRHETYFRVLEVGDEVSKSALRDAFSSLSERFAAHRVPEDLQHRFGEELAEVRDGLEDAFAVLSNDKLRAAYAEHRAGGHARE